MVKDNRFWILIMKISLMSVRTKFVVPLAGSGRIPCLFFLSFLLFCTGCIHRTSITSNSIHLEENSGYPLLVPSANLKQVKGDFQLATIVLPGTPLTMDAKIQRQCSIEGAAFSLYPDKASSSGQWTIESLTAQGWAKRASELDLNEEWDRFIHGLAMLQEQGCISAQENLFAIQRSIAEAIPIPASEALLFFYSFTTSGFADLTPGMQVRFEENIPGEEAGNLSRRNRSTMVSEYKVISLGQTGVALQPSREPDPMQRTEQEKLIASGGNPIFHLNDRFASKPILRLFLQTLDDAHNTQREPMLLGALNAHDLDEATHRIELNGSKECSQQPKEVTCIAFPLGTVSLLSTIWVNGHLRDYPVGTHIKTLLEALPKDKQERALKSASLERPLANGKYAHVTFPKTFLDASKVILLSGDRIQWK